LKHKAKSKALSIVQKYHPSVRKVIDATKPLILQVSKKDCDSASAGRADQCAVAKAVQRQHDGAIISATTSYVIDGETATRYKTPMAINKELVSFDRSRVFAPGEYTLNAPSKHERLGPRDRPQYTKTRSSKTPHRKYHKTAGIRSIIEASAGPRRQTR
jgi:hypothetical protein